MDRTSDEGIRNARIENLDDDDDQSKGAGRPNAWWAEQRRKEAEALAVQQEGPDTFTGSVRGTRSAPHGGAQSVTEADVAGALDLCWCGEPLDHDWPGKERGRRHPRREAKKVTTSDTRTRIERRQLRAYHDDLVEVITEAVNAYGARYRLRNNSIMLYPPDGTEAYQVYARNSDRQVRSARLWFIRHCVQVSATRDPKTDEPHLVSGNPVVKDPEILLDDMDRRSMERRTRELAEQLNSPEHPVPAPPPTEPEPQPEPASNLTETEGPVGRTWEPFVNNNGEANRYFETAVEDGTRYYRCKECLGTDHEYLTDTPRGIGGHIRTRHGDAQETLWGPQARAKAFDTLRFNKLAEQVTAAIELLQEVVGYTPPADQSGQVAELTNENQSLREQLAAAEQRASDLDARLTLLREAFGSLEG